MKICIRCLRKNHSYNLCKHSCKDCTKRHHHLLCLGANRDGNKGEQDDKTTASGLKPNAPNFQPVTTMMQNCDNRITVLQTAKSKILNNNKSVEISIMFDSGSDRSYLVTDIADQCNLQVDSWEDIIINSFGKSKSSKPKLSKVFKFEVLGMNNIKYTINAIGIDTICKTLHRQRIPSEILKQFELDTIADDYTSDRKMSIDLLIGLDHLYDFIDPLTTVRYESLVALQSVFGWVFSGSFSSYFKPINVQTQMCCFEISDVEIKKFWELETMGVMPKEKVNHTLRGPICDKFKENLQFKDNQYTVSLLWKENRSNLINNYPLALKRYNSLNKFLDSKPDLKEKYFDVFKQYESESKIKECDQIISDNEVFYLPHFPVVKESSSSTKVRPVFDGSAKSFDDKSLNDALEVGPSLHTNIFAILLRFRRWLIAICSDVKSAFHAINLNPVDQNVCRFLLKGVDGSIRHMQFSVLPFGLTCSPFLLNAVISTHLNKYQQSNTIHELMLNTYVDDFLSGCDSVEMAKNMHDEAETLMKEGGFTLTKWCSNSKAVDQLIGITTKDSNYVLGLNYNLITDTFSFKEINMSQISVQITKRIILSLILRFYDPIGFLGPYIMYAKIIMQAIWRLKLKWDEVPPRYILDKFTTWLQSSNDFSSWSFNRMYFPAHTWSSITRCELHGFSDASSHGFGAVVYMRISVNDEFKTAFVASKSRVAPVQRVTIPRLELLSCLLLVRLVNYILEELELENKDIKCYYYNDSSVALHWLKGSPFGQGVFIANRIQEIQNLTSPLSWHHIPGLQNPADVLSRGSLGGILYLTVSG